MGTPARFSQIKKRAKIEFLIENAKFCLLKM